MQCSEQRKNGKMGEEMEEGTRKRRINESEVSKAERGRDQRIWEVREE